MVAALPLATACFAALFSLGRWYAPDLTALTDIIYKGNANGVNFTVHDLAVWSAGSVVEVLYQADRTNITFVEPSMFGLQGTITVNVSQLTATTTAAAVAPGGDMVSVVFGLNISSTAGEALILTPTKNGTCLPASATVATCSLQLTPTARAGVAGAPEFDDFATWLVNLLVVDPLIKDLRRSCLGATDLLADALLNVSANASAAVPLEPLPPPVYGACDLHSSKLIRMAVNVASHLPEVFGITPRLALVGPTALHASIEVDSFATDPIPLGPNSWIFLPPGTTVSLDIDLGDVTCPDDTTIVLRSDLALFNVRLSSRDPNVPEVMFNRFLANATATAITDALRLIVVLDGGVMTLQMRSDPGAQAPVWSMALVTGASIIVGGLAAVASYVAHRQKIVLDKYGSEVSRTQRVAGDAIIIVGCCMGIVLYAWSNQTAAAWVRVGGEIDLYSFALGTSIRDMWDAGLYALALFIAIFCGFYPYFKLLAILFFSVVLQRPQSIVLQLIDVLGKFSFLDSFIMIIMAEGLTVPGIAEVHMGASFWVFLGATCLTIALGNFATHGFRMDASLTREHALQRDDVDFDGRDHPILRSAYYDGDGFQPATNASLHRSFLGFEADSPRKFRPIVAGIAFVLTTICLIVPLFVTTVTYEMSGPAAAITGAARPHTLYSLVQQSPAALAALTVATAFAAPIVFAGGFARTRVLAAWSSTDVFVVACLGGLLQLKQFTAFVLGPSMSGLLTIDAKLGWPIFLLGAAAVVSAVLTVRSSTIRG